MNSKACNYYDAVCARGHVIVMSNYVISNGLRVYVTLRPGHDLSRDTTRNFNCISTPASARINASAKKTFASVVANTSERSDLAFEQKKLLLMRSSRLSQIRMSRETR